jgi:hypothetical protein
MTGQDISAGIKKSPLLFACIVLSVLLIAAIYFRSDTLPQAEQLLAQKTAEGEKISLNVQYSAQLKEQTEAVEAAIKEIDARIISASQLGANTGYFYTLESDTGVKFIDLRQTTPATVAKPAKGSFLPVAFSVSVQSDLNHILGFLQQLENGTHYCRIMTATCSGNSSSRSAPLTLALSLELLGTP